MFPADQVCPIALRFTFYVLLLRRPAPRRGCSTLYAGRLQSPWRPCALSGWCPRLRPGYGCWAPRRPPPGPRTPTWPRLRPPYRRRLLGAASLPAPPPICPGAQHEVDLLQRLRVRDVVAWERAHYRVEAAGREGQGLGASPANQQRLGTIPAGLARCMAKHLRRQVDAPGFIARPNQVEVQVAGAHADLKHPGARQEMKRSALPAPPLAQEEDLADPVVGPREGSIQRLKSCPAESGPHSINR